MERIQNKRDFYDNKARPGSVWVSGFNYIGRNDHLRAIDPDGAEMRFTPESRYYASCTIKRGQPVSIAQLDDLTEEQSKNKYPYVKITDPDIDDSCLGIALNYAEEGQIVHIQNHGKFNFYTTESPYYGKKASDGKLNEEREVFLDASNWDFDKVRGQRLFIKKIYNNETNAYTFKSNDSNGEEGTFVRQQKLDENKDSFDTDHTDYERGIDPTDWFTFDFYDSVYNAKNTIQIGYLTDAPTEATRHHNIAYKCSEEIADIVYDYDQNEIIENKEKSTKTTYLFTEIGKDENGNDIVLSKKEGTPVVYKNGAWYHAVTDKKMDHADYTWMVALKYDDTKQKFVPLNGSVSFEEVDWYSFDDFIVTVELDVTGDTRGPVDNTQFILRLGEDILIKNVKQDIDLEAVENDEYKYGPDFNLGVYDEIKVVAIANGHARPPKFGITTITGADKVIPSQFQMERREGDDVVKFVEPAFISLRRLDGDTYIIPIFNNLELNKLPGSFISAQDEGYFKLSQGFASLKDNQGILKNEIIIGPVVEQLTRDNLIPAIKVALATIFKDRDTDKNLINEDGSVQEDEIEVTNVGDNGFQITTKKVGGHYDIYVSENLLGWVAPKNIDFGQTAEQGEAILADIRDLNRLNVVGVVISGKSGILKRGERIKVMKMGRIVTLGNLWPGKEYYLGLNGRITAKKYFWYDHSLKVGIADSSNYFIVNCEDQPLRGYSGNFPLGYIKPAVNGLAEKGFLLCDGVTIYSKSKYKELYEALLNWFAPEQLDPARIQEDDWKHDSLIKFHECFGDFIQEWDTYKEKVVSNENRIAAVETKNEEQDKLILEAEESKEIEELRNQVLQLMETKYNALLDKINEISQYAHSMDENLQSQIKAVKDDLDLAWAKIKEDSKNIESLTKSLNELAELVNTFKNEYSDKIDNIDKTLEDLQTEIDDIRGNIKDLQAQVDENEEKLAKVDAKLDETVNAILKGESSEEYTPDDENSKKLSEAEIEELKTIAAALSNQKKSLKNEIASLEKRIDDLENELTTKLDAKADFEGYEINGLTSSKLSDILQELKDLIENATTVEESFNVNDSETN